MSDCVLRPRVLPEPTSFHSWSRTCSIYYPIDLCWTLKDFHSMKDANVGRNLHPYFTSKKIYDDDMGHIRFFMQLYPCGNDRTSQNRAQLYLCYETDGTEKAKVYMTANFVKANTSSAISPRVALKCVMKPGSRKVIDNLIDHETMDYWAGQGFNFDSLNIQMKVFIDTEQLVSLQYEPMNAEERDQLEIQFRREVLSDLVNFLDHEVNIQLNAKAILDNGFKVLLGALLPDNAQAIKDNFDDFFNSYLEGINSEALNELFRFLFNGDGPRSVSTVLETAARKLNIVSLVDAIEEAQLKNKLILSGANKGQVDQTEMAGPSGLASSSQMTAPLSGKPTKATLSRKFSYLKLSGKRPKVKKSETPTNCTGDVNEQFTLTHIWAINNVVTDPTKDKFIESPKFYPPDNKHVKFSLRLRMPQKGKEFISLSASAHLDGYKEIEVECLVLAKDKDKKTLSGPFSAEKILKNNGSICIPHFISKNCHVLENVENADNDKDIISIYCKIIVKLYQPRPVVEEELSKTGFNSVNLVNKLGSLLVSGECADFELRVGEELQVFRVHRAILFARSKPLRDMYYDPVNRGGDLSSVEYRTLSAEVMPDILLHMYTGKCPPVGRMTVQMCEAAHMLKLNSLHHECVNAVADTFTVDTMVDFLERAHLKNDEKLKHMCFEYRLEHFDLMEEDPKLAKFMIENAEVIIEYMIYIDDKDMYSHKE